MEAKEIASIISENQHQKFAPVFGLRTEDRELKVGESLGTSHKWDYESDNFVNDEFMSGICATGFDYLWLDGEEEDAETVQKALEIQGAYYGKHQYLIIGEDAGCGDDEAEVIIKNAVVLAVIK